MMALSKVGEYLWGNALLPHERRRKSYAVAPFFIIAATTAPIMTYQMIP
jgi:hypothetical protein